MFSCHGAWENNYLKNVLIKREITQVEELDETDASDPCDPSQIELYMNYDDTNPTWAAADCDSDTVINADELTNGTNPYFMDYLTKSFTEGDFTYVPYSDIAGPTVKRGLNISSHDIANKQIAGTYSFVAVSVGEESPRWYFIFSQSSFLFLFSGVY